MKNTLGILAAMAIVSVGLPALSASTASVQDVSFMHSAAQGGMAEVAQGTIAERQASSSAVKSFAAKMVADHGKANQKLASIAKAKAVTLPSSVDAADSKMKGTLEGLHGAAFDASYLRAQHAAHVKTATLFKGEIANGKDADVVAFAKMVLPTVEEHIALITTELKTLGKQPAPGGSMPKGVTPH